MKKQLFLTNPFVMLNTSVQMGPNILPQRPEVSKEVIILYTEYIL